MPPPTRIRAFLLLFAALFLLALSLAIAAEFSDAKWIKAIISIGNRLEPLIVVAIAVTFLSVEGGPMLASWVRREEIKEAREQGRVEGRALEREAWQEWQRNLDAWELRKFQAENEGRDFQEPRPAPPSED